MLSSYIDAFGGDKMNKLKKRIGLLITVISIGYLVFTFIYEASIMEVSKSVEVFHGDESINGAFMLKDYFVVGNDMLALFSVAGKEMNSIYKFDDQLLNVEKIADLDAKYKRFSTDLEGNWIMIKDNKIQCWSANDIKWERQYNSVQSPQIIKNQNGEQFFGFFQLIDGKILEAIILDFDGNMVGKYRTNRICKNPQSEELKRKVFINMNEYIVISHQIPDRYCVEYFEDETCRAAFYTNKKNLGINGGRTFYYNEDNRVLYIPSKYCLNILDLTNEKITVKGTNWKEGRGFINQDIDKYSSVMMDNIWIAFVQQNNSQGRLYSFDVNSEKSRSIEYNFDREIKRILNIYKSNYAYYLLVEGTDGCLGRVNITSEII